MSKAIYSGNGSTTAFAVPFYFLAAADLEVILRTGTTETVQALTTNYTVSGAGDEAGGTVTMLVAPASGTTLTIRRSIAATQGTDLLPNDRLPAEDLEDGLDKLTMIAQQLGEESGRSLKYPASDAAVSAQIPAASARASKFLSFDANGLPVATVGVDASLDIFTQTGTGAVARSVNSKLGDFVNVKDFGAVGDGVTDDTNAIKAAIAAAKLNGQRVTGSGTFRISSKVVINCAFDGSDMTFNVYGAPPIAVEVSTGNGDNPTDILFLSTELGITLPSVVNMTKPPTGWAGQGIGVRYVNVQNMKIVERLVSNFDIGIQLTAYVQGCSYNTIFGGYLRNNRINRQITVGDQLGFNNRIDYYGGRYFHFSSEGVETPGVIHVDIVAVPVGSNIINDHNFFGASLEGVAEQYHIKNGGTIISFWGCRLESNTPGGIKVHLAYNGIPGQGAIGIFNGRGGEADINITRDVGASERIGIQSYVGRNLLSTPAPSIIRNTNSAAEPALVAYEPTESVTNTDPLTNYSGFLGPQKIGGKRAADDHDRIYMDLSDGRLYFGPGNSAASQYFGRVGTAGVGPINTGLAMTDGISAPGTVSGHAFLYVDSADGDLKVKFGDGVVKTIATDT